MNAGRDLAELACQHRPCRGELLVTQNLARDGFALDPRHDEAGAEIVFGLQHMHHFRRRQSRIMRELHQDGLGVEPGRAPGRGAIARRRAAQDRADIAARMQDIERPGLLAGAAGKFCRAGNAGRSRKKGGDAASELRFDHLPSIICL